MLKKIKKYLGYVADEAPLGVFLLVYTGCIIVMVWVVMFFIFVLIKLFGGG